MGNSSALHAYVRTLSPTARADFIAGLASASGHSVAHVGNVIYGHRKASAALAMQAELLSNGKVRRESLRDDAVRIWPEGNQMVDPAIVAPELSNPVGDGDGAHGGSIGHLVDAVKGCSTGAAL